MVGGRFDKLSSVIVRYETIMIFTVGDGGITTIHHHHKQNREQKKQHREYKKERNTHVSMGERYQIYGIK